MNTLFTKETEGEIVFPREELTNWLYNTKWSLLKKYGQVTLYRLGCTQTSRNICLANIYIYEIIINKNKSMNLKYSMKYSMNRYMPRVYRKKGRSDIIIISKDKNKLKKEKYNI